MASRARAIACSLSLATSDPGCSLITFSTCCSFGGVKKGGGGGMACFCWLHLFLGHEDEHKKPKSSVLLSNSLSKSSEEKDWLFSWQEYTSCWNDSGTGVVCTVEVAICTAFLFDKGAVGICKFAAAG